MRLSAAVLAAGDQTRIYLIGLLRYFFGSDVNASHHDEGRAKQQQHLGGKYTIGTRATLAGTFATNKVAFGLEVSSFSIECSKKYNSKLNNKTTSSKATF